MLLVAYERREGSKYLSQMLTHPLGKIFPLLSNCEMDPQKLKNQNPNATPEEIESKLESNRASLQKACATLFDSIFDPQRKMPLSIRDMCSFLHNLITEGDEKVTNDSSADSAPAELELKPAQDEAFRRQSALSKSKLQEIKSSASGEGLGSQGGLNRRKSIMNVFKFGSLGKDVGFASLGRENSLKEVPQLQPTDESLRLSTCTITKENCDKPREKFPPASRRVTAPSVPSPDVSKINNQAPVNLGVLTLAARVVGSMLFLRFIVPGKSN